MDHAAGSQESYSFNADNPGKHETSSVLGVMQRATAQYSQVRKHHWNAADDDSLGTLSDAGAFPLWDSIAEDTASFAPRRWRASMTLCGTLRISSHGIHSASQQARVQ